MYVRNVCMYVMYVCNVFVMYVCMKCVCECLYVYMCMYVCVCVYVCNAAREIGI